MPSRAMNSATMPTIRRLVPRAAPRRRATCASRELLGRDRGTTRHRSDLVEGHGEQVVWHKRESLGRGPTFEVPRVARGRANTRFTSAAGSSDLIAPHLLTADVTPCTVSRSGPHRRAQVNHQSEDAVFDNGDGNRGRTRVPSNQAVSRAASVSIARRLARPTSSSICTTTSPLSR